MQRLIHFAIIQFLLISHCTGQSSIDLKILIGLTKDSAFKKLERWNIKLMPTHWKSTFSAYNDGIQLEINHNKVSAIWIEFTDRHSGTFPYQVDSIIKPNVNVFYLMKRLGKPDETSGFQMDKKLVVGWVKWNRKECQVHCELKESEVIMVTLMKPDWTPGSQ